MLLFACNNNSGGGTKSEVSNACDCLKQAANKQMLVGNYAQDNDLIIACKDFAGELEANKENEAKMKACLIEVRKNIEDKILFEGSFNETVFYLDTAIKLNNISNEVLNYHYKNVPAIFDVIVNEKSVDNVVFSSIWEEAGKFKKATTSFAFTLKLNKTDIEKVGNAATNGSSLYDVNNKTIIVDGNPYINGKPSISGYQQAIEFLRAYNQNETDKLKDLYSFLMSANIKLAQQVYKGEIALVEPGEGSDNYVFNKVKIKATINKIKLNEVKMLGGKIQTFLIDVSDPQILEVTPVSKASEAIQPLKVDFDINYQAE